jgi:hypothetical protein
VGGLRAEGSAALNSRSLNFAMLYDDIHKQRVRPSNLYAAEVTYRS